MIEIENNAKTSEAVVKIIGVGGAGNNAINRLEEDGVCGVELIGMNTAVKDLGTVRGNRIQLGERLTRDLGAGARPEVGEKAAEESSGAISEALKGAEMANITCGIDEDTFSALQDKNEVESAIKEIYGLPGSEGSTDEIERLCLFIPYFISALQVDEDNALSKEELNNLKVSLKCSVVTSVNATTEDPDSDSRDWDYRSKNKELVKETAEKLKNIGNFTAWMPRKARPGVKFSDISGWYTYPKQQIKILVAEVEESAKI